MGAEKNGASAVEEPMGSIIGRCLPDTADRVSALLAQGYPPDGQGYRLYNDMTPLGIALSKKNAAVVSMLIKAGAGMETRDGSGHTPIFHALGEFIPLIISEGGDPNAQDKDGRTRIMWECSYPECVEAADALRLLLEANANPDIKDGSGRTPLHVLVTWMDKYRLDRRLAAVGLLLEFGADVGARTPDGSTALHISNRDYSPPELTRMLLDAGADVNAPDEKGRTPLHAAMFSRDPIKAAMLLEAGADPRVKDLNGKRPYDYGGTSKNMTDLREKMRCASRALFERDALDSEAVRPAPSPQGIRRRI